MTGMTVVMVLGMVSSIALGLIAGIIFAGDLTISTIIAMVFGIIVGVLTGKSISDVVMLEGIGAGIMGGMMGAMTGDMLPPDGYYLMTVFMDVCFIASVLFISHIINQELKKANMPVSKYRFYPWIITSIASVMIIFTFAHLDTNKEEPSNQVNSVNQQHHQHH